MRLPSVFFYAWCLRDSCQGLVGKHSAFFYTCPQRKTFLYAKIQLSELGREINVFRNP